MQRFQKGFGLPVLLAILAVLLLSGGAYVYLQTKPHTSPSIDSSGFSATSTPQHTDNTSSHATSPSVDEDTTSAHYVDSKNGFAFSYPSDMMVYTSGYNAVAPLEAAPFGKEPAVYVTARNDVQQTEGYILVAVSDNTDAVANCMYNEIKPVPLEAINGISYLPIKLGGTGPGSIWAFKTKYQNKCYLIEAIAYPSACINSGCLNPRWSAKTEKQMLDLFMQVLQHLSLTSQ